MVQIKCPVLLGNDRNGAPFSGPRPVRNSRWSKAKSCPDWSCAAAAVRSSSSEQAFGSAMHEMCCTVLPGGGVAAVMLHLASLRQTG